jgi:hypothetical protein
VCHGLGRVLSGAPQGRGGIHGLRPRRCNGSGLTRSNLARFGNDRVSRTHIIRAQPTDLDPQSTIYFGRAAVVSTV